MRTWYHKLSIEHVWALTVVVGIFVFVNTHPIRPHDFWWHMAAGREILESGSIPQVDTFSHTMAGTPYPSYQAFWLMEVAMFMIHRLGGPALTVFIQGLVITGAYAIVLWLGRRISGSWRAAAVGTLLAAALGLNDWNVRPQAVTFAIAALFLLAMYEYRRTRHRAWLAVLPLGMVVWVNSHGTFPLGLFLIGCWLADEAWEAVQAHGFAWKPLTRALSTPLLTLGICAAACAISPRGLGTFGYVSGMSGNPLIQNLVTEWAPPTFDTLGGQLFFGGLLLSAAALALSPRRPTPSQLLTFLFFGALGLRTSRGILWFGLTMAPVIAAHLRWTGDSLRRAEFLSFLSPVSGPRSSVAGPRRAMNAVLALLLLTGAVLSLPWFKGLWPLPPEKAGLISAETPVAATEFLLRERPPGPLFHAMSFGSYLIWAAPEYPTFVDGRIELFTEEVWLDYLRISAAASGWEERLERYGIQTLMLSSREQAGLVAAVRESGGWEEIHNDEASALFVAEK
ncbi:MAG: hypothetical protein JW892_00850 [Anaerolineae bacterium]|nr:hypothetical protein [Anaerolineae bacterium]